MLLALYGMPPPLLTAGKLYRSFTTNSDVRSSWMGRLLPWMGLFNSLYVIIPTYLHSRASMMNAHFTTLPQHSMSLGGKALCFTLLWLLGWSNTTYCHLNLCSLLEIWKQTDGNCLQNSGFLPKVHYSIHHFQIPLVDLLSGHVIIFRPVFTFTSHSSCDPGLLWSPGWW